jgi:hypothetical protein
MKTFQFALHSRASFAARRQQGAVALIVTTVLFFALALMAVFVNRNLVFEHRSSANQYRATQAFEAAEAGAEWALAQLNNPQRLGPDCLPSNDAAAASFQAQHFSANPAASSAQFTPTQWLQAGVFQPLQAACVAGPLSWVCSCPQGVPPALSPPAGREAAPAFTVQFVAGRAPGTVGVVATGCTAWGGECAPAAGSPADATAQVNATWGLLPALRTLPAATLTVRGGVQVGSAALSVHNVHPASGLAIHAGEHIDAEQAMLQGPPGGAPDQALAADDARLASLSPTAFFAAYFGLSPADWKKQPKVQHVVCPTDCRSAVTNAVAAADGSALIWVEGDLLLDGPATVGSANQLVVLVASGTVRLRGAVKLYGVLYGQALRWDDTSAAGAELHGAALSESSYEGNGTPQLHYDHTLLNLLTHQPAAWARVSGSWRDF